MQLLCKFVLTYSIDVSTNLHVYMCTYADLSKQFTVPQQYSSTCSIIVTLVEAVQNKEVVVD